MVLIRLASVGLSEFVKNKDSREESAVVRPVIIVISPSGRCLPI